MKSPKCQFSHKVLLLLQVYCIEIQKLQCERKNMILLPYLVIWYSVIKNIMIYFPIFRQSQQLQQQNTRKKSKKKLFPFKKHFKKAAFIHFCRISRFFFKWKIIQINFVQNAIVGCIKVCNICLVLRRGYVWA